ncbi:hypothetical protein LCM10_03300 [Rossellomorea aquimaris]|uniref:hypothetical protein n=1 Tax=Rossellomorea aquimaris TaxID=189382 RepID=UPI001CD4D28C|nr:hypothetical protein [Rossellomorea aquimaris]MCA1054002.1 hypothetical protein [Rossellomorea aquimaris]
MRKKFTTFFVFIVTLQLLTACNGKVETINFDNKGDTKLLFVQKVENFTSREELTKEITDQSKINRMIDSLDGIEAMEISSNKATDLMESQDAYMFSFSKTKQLTTGMVPFGFVFLEDGTIIFTHREVDQLREKPLVTTDTHEELLTRIKDDLEVEF